jgi:hypothetical protein
LNLLHILTNHIVVRINAFYGLRSLDADFLYSLDFYSHSS